MILNGISIGQVRGDDKKYAIPALKAGQKFEILYNDTSAKCPGVRSTKAGRYVIEQVRDSFNQKIKPAKSYVFKLDRKNATYEWWYNTVAIDKCVELGLIILE